MLTGTDLNGEPVDTSTWQGSPGVINVGVVVCSVPREAPELVAVAKQNPDVNFLGLDTRDSDAPRGLFVEKFGIPYPNLPDPDGQLVLQFSDSLPPQAIPSTLLVDAQGRVAVGSSAPSRPVSSTLRCRTSLPKTRRSLRVSVAETVTGGSLLLAIRWRCSPVSCRSPRRASCRWFRLCGVVTGVTGAELTEPVAPTQPHTHRVGLFIAGFSFVFISYGALLGYAGECCWSTRSRYSGSSGS